MSIAYMNIALWIVQVGLAVLFIFTGGMKVFQYEKFKESMPWVNEYSKGMVTFIGISEFLGGLGLILPMLTNILPWLTPLAAIGLSVVMVLAGIFHLRRGEWSNVITNAVLVALSLFVVFGRWDLMPF